MDGRFTGEDDSLPLPLSPVQRLVSSFRYREFRWYWTGSVLTIVGFRIQEVVLGWQILEETDSAFWLGAVAFAYGLPLLLLSPVTGLLADKLRRQNVVMSGLAMAAVASGTLALLIFTERSTPIAILIISLALGCSFTLYAPSRVALLPNLVPAQQLVNASAMEYSSTRLMGFFGPVLAGLLLDTLNTGPTLLVQMVLFFVAGLFFLFTGVNVGKPTHVVQVGVRHGLRDAIAFLRREPALLALMLLGLFIVPFGMTYRRLMQVFVRDILVGGPTLLGLALGLAGLGSAASGFIIVMMENIRRGRAVIISSFGFGLGLIALSLSRQIPSTLIVMLAIGLISGIYLTLSHVIFQTEAPDEMRGRVLSLWGMVWGIVPLMTLAAGALAEEFNVTVVIAATGFILILSCASFAIARSKLLEL